MSESSHSPESYALIGSMFITNAEGLGCDSFFTVMPRFVQVNLMSLSSSLKGLEVY